MENSTLRMLFFPFMAPGHMLPMLDMAKLFSARGVNCSVLTTPANASLIKSSLEHNAVEIITVPFPSVEAGLPDGCENLYTVPSPELEPNFFKATGMLSEPFDGVIRQLLPHCVVTDMFLPWVYHAAEKLNIPTLLFYGVGLFAHCCYSTIPEEEEDFVVFTGLPREVKMLKSQLGNVAEERPELMNTVMLARKVEEKCYGSVWNTFFELEGDYCKHYKEVIGRNTWQLGPVSLCNTDTDIKFNRGHAVSVSSQDCITWLDKKTDNSVVYVCFGSGCDFSTSQLHEIALGLETSDCPFVWVVRRDGKGWMPEGYEERIRNKGLIIRGWAPQLPILNHAAVGGFVTHCGWNSVLEGVAAGVTFVTWPSYADQFFNEKLVVDVLKIGVAVGIRRMVGNFEEREVVEAERIARIAWEAMDGGDEAEERKRKGRELGMKARSAVARGGSSYVDMGNLIDQLKEKALPKKMV